MTTERRVDGIDFILRKNRGQRSLRVHLDSAGRVVVSAPYHAPLSEIDSFVRSSASWIEKHRSKVAEHTYETGDCVPYLGRKLSLLILEGKKARYDVIDDKIIITVRKQDAESVKKVIKRLYVETVGDFMKRRVPHWCAAIGADVPDFGVNRAKGKWGVCYPLEKRLYLSYMCATLPEDLIDMTVLHEVCHLRYSGHGKDFWNLVRANMPDLDERKARLAEVAKSGWTYNIV